MSIRRYYPELLAALAPLIVFWQIIFAGKVLYWGLPALQFMPWRVLVDEAWRAGQIPAWTTLLGMGAPLLANHQTAIFYPPNLLSLLFNPAQTISMLAVLHLSFAGVGMVRVARRLGLSDFGAAIVGLTFGLSQYLTARLWFVSINNAITWLPWIVLSADSLVRQPKRPFHLSLFTTHFLSLAVLITLQLFAGHAQSSFYTLLIAVGWVAWQSSKPSQEFYKSFDEVNQLARESLKSLFINLSLFAIAVLFAFSLAAIQLLPTYELLRESPRAEAAAYDFAMNYSLWGWRLVSFILPDAFGNPADGNFWGYASYWEDAAYMGFMPFMFVVYALLTSRRNKKIHLGDFVFFIALIIISVEFALGKNTPIYPFFYRYVPFFNMFQAPARWLIGYTFAFSLLAGIGADAWQRSERKRYWSRLGMAGSLLMIILGIAGRLVATDERVQTLALAVAGGAAVGAVTFILTLNQPAAPHRWRYLVLIFITCDLGFAGARLTPTTEASLYQLQLKTVSGRVFYFSQDEEQVKYKEFANFKSFQTLSPTQLRSIFLANLSVFDQIESVNNFDPLLTSRYVNYLKVLEQNPRLLDLADVRVLLKPQQTILPRETNLTKRIRYLPQGQLVASPAGSLAFISQPNFDPETQLVLEKPQSSIFNLQAFSLARSSHTLQVPFDAYVLFSDAYYPGWRVWVDGQPAPLLIADHLFRAVLVPKGEHVVTFEYAPLSFTVGLSVSVAGLIIWVMLLGVARLKKQIS